jgi:hypothetical protein
MFARAAASLAALVFTAVAIAGAAAALRAADVSADKLAVGVLRRDGLVIPFATFDGKRWRKDWPEPRQTVDVPAALSSVPSRWWGPLKPIETWQAWIGSDSARTLQVHQPDWYEAHCVQQVGLRTDYRSKQPPPDPREQPYPKDGLVVSPPQPQVGRIDIVAPGSPMPPVVDAFNEAERKAIRRFEDRGKHPVKEAQRGAVPLKIEAMYATGSPTAARIYYVEVSKQYDYPDRFNPDARFGRCAMVSYGAGWFIREGNGPLKPLGFDVAVVPCHREAIRYMFPLGAMRIDGRLFWIAQWSGWDYEEYTIVEIKPEKDKTEVAVRVWGGGC